MNIIDLKVVPIDERGGRVVRVYQHENLLADGPRTNTVLEYHHFASILLAIVRYTRVNYVWNYSKIGLN